jgi:hypothetical protein
MNLEGDENGPTLPTIKVVNDYITAWLLSTGIVEALARRAIDGGSYRVHVSLTRAALWLISLGVFKISYATAVGGTGGAHAYLDPQVFTADTPMGPLPGSDRPGQNIGNPRILPRCLGPPGLEPSRVAPPVLTKVNADAPQVAPSNEKGIRTP